MRLILPALFFALAVPPSMAGTQADRPLPARPDDIQTIDEARPDCIRRPNLCRRFGNMVSFPAHALSWSDFGSFALHTRGVDWTGSPGAMTFTMRRPLAYTAGSRVRLRLVYDIPGDGDLDTIGFAITPTSFNDGSGFETYGGESTGLVPAGSGTIHEQFATFTFPGPYSLGGDWWYFEISRAGDFEGKLRLMSVAVEY